MKVTLPAGVVKTFKDIQLNFEALAKRFSDVVAGRTENNLSVVRGSVAGTGTIVAGSGFSVVKHAVGDWTIDYATAFSGLPSPVVTAQPSANNVYAVINNGRTNDAASFSVLGWNSGTAALADTTFHFVAIGPA